MPAVYVVIGVTLIFMFLLMINMMKFMGDSIVYRIYIMNTQAYDKVMTFFCVCHLIAATVFWKLEHRHTAGMIGAIFLITIIFFCLFVRIIDQDILNGALDGEPDACSDDPKKTPETQTQT